MNELTYTRCGDYYIPDLKLSEQPEAPIGKYGRMRQRYLKEHRPGLYSSMISVWTISLLWELYFCFWSYSENSRSPLW